MSQSRNGVSAKEIERQLGVTYKTAWRIQKQIRKLMIAHKTQMHGVVEVDEAYIGGFHPGTTGRGSVNKTPIVGIVERNGEVRAVVIENVKSSTIVPLIKESVADDARLITDDYNIYRTPALNGYKHDIIRHEFGDYVRGDIHTNNIEGFWSQLKRSIYGTYHHVSRKYLQSYTDEFSYRYNRRDSDKHLFTHLLEEIVEVPVSKG